MKTANIKSVRILYLDNNDETIEHNSVDQVVTAINDGQIKSLGQYYCSVVAEVNFQGVEYNIQLNRDAINLCGSETEWEPSETEGEYSELIMLANDENEAEIMEIMNSIEDATVSHFQAAGLN